MFKGTIKERLPLICGETTHDATTEMKKKHATAPRKITFDATIFQSKGRLSVVGDPFSSGRHFEELGFQDQFSSKRPFEQLVTLRIGI